MWILKENKTTTGKSDDDDDENGKGRKSGRVHQTRTVSINGWRKWLWAKHCRIFSPWHLLLHTTARVMDSKRKIKITQTITVKHNPSVSTPFDSNITNMHAFTHCCTSFHKLLHEHNSYYDGIMTSEKWKLRKIIIKKK